MIDLLDLKQDSSEVACVSSPASIEVLCGIRIGEVELLPVATMYDLCGPCFDDPALSAKFPLRSTAVVGKLLMVDTQDELFAGTAFGVAAFPSGEIIALTARHNLQPNATSFKQIYWCDNVDAHFHNISQLHRGKHPVFPCELLATGDQEYESRCPVHKLKHTYKGDIAALVVQTHRPLVPFIGWPWSLVLQFAAQNDPPATSGKLHRALEKIMVRLQSRTDLVTPDFVKALQHEPAQPKRLMQWWCDRAAELWQFLHARESERKFFVPSLPPRGDAKAIVDGYPADFMNPLPLPRNAVPFHPIVAKAIPCQGRTLAFGSPIDMQNDCLALRAATLRGNSGSPCTLLPEATEQELLVHGLLLGGCPCREEQTFIDALKCLEGQAIITEKRAAAAVVYEFSHNIALMMTAKCCVDVLCSVFHLPGVVQSVDRAAWAPYEAFAKQHYGISLFG
eukprot:TRINITY_DN6072_c1_g1_i1.p1 TRINITY_DN6072_c1_g1~~TRINITY_DN6072_c1_g1_i1.p1  ORF type:complete len:451 (+),score=52.67 TRINITY_DN6072_c1_g1_i1:32-1384(+)